MAGLKEKAQQVINFCSQLKNIDGFHDKLYLWLEDLESGGFGCNTSGFGCDTSGHLTKIAEFKKNP